MDDSCTKRKRRSPSSRCIRDRCASASGAPPRGICLRRQARTIPYSVGEFPPYSAALMRSSERGSRNSPPRPSAERAEAYAHRSADFPLTGILAGAGIFPGLNNGLRECAGGPKYRKFDRRCPAAVVENIREIPGGASDHFRNLPSFFPGEPPSNSRIHNG
jgi:hypothetical protein